MPSFTEPPNGGKGQIRPPLRLAYPAPPKPPKSRHRRASLFIGDEETRLKAALRNARARFGSWRLLAAAMGVERDTLAHAAMPRKVVSADVAVRLDAARAAYRLSGVIKSAAYAAGVEPRDVEDVVQLVAVAAARAAEKGDVAWASPDAFRSWLYIVALRDALRYAERARRDVVGPHEEPDGIPSCEGRYEAIETLAILRASTTPERFRALTSCARGVPIAEIARRAGLSVPGAYNRIRLARDDMRAALRRR